MTTKQKTNPDAIEKWLKELDKELDKLAKLQAEEIDAVLDQEEEDDPDEE